ncbi:YjbF family lipoprotein [Loktanella sp. SALINAS62]|uniref:YjbF family lipoprotein n=1 Tax=Loktanella sp. SALINAS62 TaxID=2706124 RepID=UPI001B8AFD15|nr:YjbF family lipoprotein [Loktanella sp. SALINAS62]MBS1302333.1 YjbF family lipoprotein [Loktanella sp. SALINAS62]
MTPALKTMLAVTFAAGLSACGPLNDNDQGAGALKLAAQSLSIPGRAAAPEEPPMVVSRAMIDQLPGDVLVVEAYDGTSRAVMVPAAINLNRVTWISEDSVSIVTENGIVIATRGFPRDLMAASVIESRRALAAGGGTAERTHETLSDMDQISTEVLQCSINFIGTETISIVERPLSTQRYEENCENENISFSNTYWLNESGEIVRSRQAISPELGYLVLDRP